MNSFLTLQLRNVIMYEVLCSIVTKCTFNISLEDSPSDLVNKYNAASIARSWPNKSKQK